MTTDPLARNVRALAGRGRAAGRRPPPPGSHLPPSVPQGLHLPRRRTPSCPTSATWASAISTPRPICRPAPAASTATTSPTTTSQPRDRHRRRLRGAGRGPARTRHGPDPRHGAQPHGHRQRQPLVERRAGKRPRVALRRLLRHRLAVVAAAGAARPPPGADPRRSLRQGARIAAGPPRLRERRLYDPLFRPSLSRRALHLRHGPRPTPRRTEGRPRRGRPAGPGVPQHPQRRRPPAGPHRKPTRPSSPSGSARRKSSNAASPPLPRRASRSASSSSRTWPCSTARRATRRASTCWTSCSTPRPTGCRSGASPPTRSTTAASSTSTSWRR